MQRLRVERYNPRYTLQPWFMAEYHSVVLALSELLLKILQIRELCTSQFFKKKTPHLVSSFKMYNSYVTCFNGRFYSFGLRLLSGTVCRITMNIIITCQAYPIPKLSNVYFGFLIQRLKWAVGGGCQITPLSYNLIDKLYKLSPI